MFISTCTGTLSGTPCGTGGVGAYTLSSSEGTVASTQMGTIGYVGEFMVTQGGQGGSGQAGGNAYGTWLINNSTNYPNYPTNGSEYGFNGEPGQSAVNSSTAPVPISGRGAGQGGGPGVPASTAGVSATWAGAGGAGGGGVASTAAPGGGGQQGAFAHKTILFPAIGSTVQAAFAYGNCAGGAAGTGTNAGGAGAAGMIRTGVH